jgi:nucleotide-binding universal stress UspA family protein
MTENPLIVGIDGSPEAREALRWASRMAAGRGRDIIAVHALGLLESIDGAVVSADNHRARIEEIVRRDWCSTLRSDGHDVHAVVCDGDPIDVLIDTASKQAAAMLIVGSRGAGAAPALTLGSTSLHLVQESSVPVLMVPDPEHAGRHLALQRILVAIDGTPACRPAIELAADIAAQFEARVELVLAVDDAPVFPLGPAARVTMAGEWAAPAQARRDAEPYCHQVRDHGVPVHLTVERGEPEEVVRKVAARLDADLIIAATHRAGHLDEGLLESVSRRIVHLAHRPTLVVPVARPHGRTADRSWTALGPIPSVP